MIILKILLVGLVLGILTRGYFKWEFIGDVLIGICSILLIIVAITIPLNIQTTKADIQSYYVLKNTIEEARNNNFSELERAGLVNRIIENNIALAKYQYYNNTIWDLWIPDEIMDLEPLK